MTPNVEEIPRSGYTALWSLRAAVHSLQGEIPNIKGEKRHSLNLEQLECFIEIALHGGITGGEIAETRDTGQWNVSRHASVLDRRGRPGSDRPGLGWIRRTSVSENLTYTPFYLTAAGKRVVAEVARAPRGEVP